MDVSRKMSRTITQYTNELLMISLKALALATLLSIIDVGSDFIQGINLSMDPELVLYGIITIAINWLPGAIGKLLFYQNFITRWQWRVKSKQGFFFLFHKRHL